MATASLEQREVTHLRIADQPIELRRSLCRRSVLAWAANCWPSRIKPYRHSKLVDNRLNRLLDHDNDHNYLMVSQPPRTGKTMLGLIFAGTQYLAMNPDHNVYVVTHAQSTGNKWGRQAKHIFQTHAPEIFGVELDHKSKANANWGVKGHEGSFNAIGWGGPITGQKIHLLILDDLIKDTKEALSANLRDSIWDWWDGTAMQRVQNNLELTTKVCSIQTRWHVDDLNGRLMAQERAGGAMHWDQCILPAIADRGDIFDPETGQLIMAKGEALCPEILSLEQCEAYRRTKSRYWWECNYQQRPITQDGILWSSDCFPSERFVDAWPARVKYLVVGVDPATGRALRDGDYSAIVAIGIGYDNKLYVEADLDKTGPLETCHRLARFCKGLPMPADIIAVESNGFQFLVRSMGEDIFETHGVFGRFEEYDTSERGVPVHKEDRIAELDSLIVARDIFWVRSEGTQMLVSQLQNFPSQDHDDGPDALELASWVLAQFNE